MSHVIEFNREEFLRGLYIPPEEENALKAGHQTVPQPFWDGRKQIKALARLSSPSPPTLPAPRPQQQQAAPAAVIPVASPSRIPAAPTANGDAVARNLLDTFGSPNKNPSPEFRALVEACNKQLEEGRSVPSSTQQPRMISPMGHVAMLTQRASPRKPLPSKQPSASREREQPQTTSPPPPGHQTTLPQPQDTKLSSEKRGSDGHTRPMSPRSTSFQVVQRPQQQQRELVATAATTTLPATQEEPQRPLDAVSMLLPLTQAIPLGGTPPAPLSAPAELTLRNNDALQGCASDGDAAGPSSRMHQIPTPPTAPASQQQWQQQEHQQGVGRNGSSSEPWVGAVSRWPGRFPFSLSMFRKKSATPSGTNADAVEGTAGSTAHLREHELEKAAAQYRQEIAAQPLKHIQTVSPAVAPFAGTVAKQAAQPSREDSEQHERQQMQQEIGQVQPSVVRGTEVQPSVVRGTEVQPSVVRGTEVQPAIENSSMIDAADIPPTQALQEQEQEEEEEKERNRDDIPKTQAVKLDEAVTQGLQHRESMEKASSRQPSSASLERREERNATPAPSPAEALGLNRTKDSTEHVAAAMEPSLNQKHPATQAVELQSDRSLAESAQIKVTSLSEQKQQVPVVQTQEVVELVEDAVVDVIAEADGGMVEQHETIMSLDPGGFNPGGFNPVTQENYALVTQTQGEFFMPYMPTQVEMQHGVADHAQQRHSAQQDAPNAGIENAYQRREKDVKSFPKAAAAVAAEGGMEPAVATTGTRRTRSASFEGGIEHVPRKKAKPLHITPSTGLGERQQEQPQSAGEFVAMVETGAGEPPQRLGRTEFALHPSGAVHVTTAIPTGDILRENVPMRVQPTPAILLPSSTIAAREKLQRLQLIRLAHIGASISAAEGSVQAGPAPAQIRAEGIVSDLVAAIEGPPSTGHQPSHGRAPELRRQNQPPPLPLPPTGGQQPRHPGLTMQVDMGGEASYGVGGAGMFPSHTTDQTPVHAIVGGATGPPPLSRGAIATRFAVQMPQPPMLSVGFTRSGSGKGNASTPNGRMSLNELVSMLKSGRQRSVANTPRSLDHKSISFIGGAHAFRKR